MREIDIDLDTLAERIVDGNSLELLALNSEQGQLLYDLVDEDEQEVLIGNVLNLVYLDGGLDYLEKDSARRDSHKEISEMCRELARRIGDWGRLNEVLTLLSEYFSAKAESSDPKGKKPRRVTARTRIAEALLFMSDTGQLNMSPATNPKSDFARLFRLLCDILDVPESQNVAFYLDPLIEQMNEGLWRAYPEEEIKEQICELIGMKYPPYLDRIQDDDG